MQSAGFVLTAISLTCGDLVGIVMLPTCHNVRCPVNLALPERVKTLLKSLLHEQISKLQSQLLGVLSGAATSSWDAISSLKAAVVRLSLHSFFLPCC